MSLLGLTVIIYVWIQPHGLVEVAVEVTGLWAAVLISGFIHW